MLDTVLDDLERSNPRIRYYRFLKVPETGYYVFKTFIDHKDGHTFQFTGTGPTRVDAAIECLNNITFNRPTLSETNRTSRKRNQKAKEL